MCAFLTVLEVVKIVYWEVAITLLAQVVCAVRGSFP
jgi:hypothetical protein